MELSNEAKDMLRVIENWNEKTVDELCEYLIKKMHNTNEDKEKERLSDLIWQLRNF